ncbi:hypothetical protein EC988_010258, partial [Linderina pennispora]
GSEDECAGDSDSDSDSDFDEPVFVDEDSYVPLDDECDDADEPDSADSAGLDISIEREIDARMHQELFSDLDTSGAVDERAGPASAAGQQLPQMARQIRPLEVDVARSTRMAADHIDQIKSIMAGIHISNHGIPEWAKIVPEGAWMPRRKPSDDGAGGSEKAG